VGFGELDGLGVGLPEGAADGDSVGVGVGVEDGVPPPEDASAPDMSADGATSSW
jgi:hypothetical protein